MAAKFGMRFSNVVAPGIKLCGTCKRELPFDSFPRRSSSRDGRGSVCSDCHRDYMRDYVRNNRDAEGHAKSQRDYRARNADRERAHSAVRQAIKQGELERPEICSLCEMPGDIEAHHEDYSKPLEIIWLCSACHGAEHRA